MLLKFKIIFYKIWFHALSRNINFCYLLILGWSGTRPQLWEMWDLPCQNSGSFFFVFFISSWKMNHKKQNATQNYSSHEIKSHFWIIKWLMEDRMAPVFSNGNSMSILKISIRNHVGFTWIEHWRLMQFIPHWHQTSFAVYQNVLSVQID